MPLASIRSFEAPFFGTSKLPKQAKEGRPEGLTHLAASLARGTALTTLMCLTFASVGHAEVRKIRRSLPATAAPVAEGPTREDYQKALNAISALTGQVQELSTEVKALHGRLDSQSTALTQAKVDQPIRTEHAGVVVEPGDMAPTGVQTSGMQMAQGAQPTDPKIDGFQYKGVHITPTGFLDASNIYRSRSLGSDAFSPFNAIPFSSTKTGHESEDRFTARQSRLGLLLQADINPTTHISGVFEMDFLGAAQTANSVEANSFNPRARQLYGTLDMDDYGLHVLVGQTWSLATMNGAGITPRNEIIPPTIESQLVPGFVWTRQPQIRVVKDFGKTLWLAMSLENPQTTFTGAVPANVTSQIANGTAFFDGAVNATAPASAGGGSAVAPTAATSSLNHLPDVVVKAAYEGKFYGRSLHLEAFGIGRAFSDRVATSDQTVYGGGVGAGVAASVLPGLLDVQASMLSGKGVGRYGTSLLPDVTFDPNGKIEPIAAVDWLVGATLHPTRTLDVYGYAGEEKQDRKTYTAAFGDGSPLLDLSGCATEGGTCPAANKFIEQGTIGLWQKVYQGPFGRVQFGLQYSYTERHAFSGLLGTAPVANDNMVFTSIRYYPF